MEIIKETETTELEVLVIVANKVDLRRNIHKGSVQKEQNSNSLAKKSKACLISAVIIARGVSDYGRVSISALEAKSKRGRIGFVVSSKWRRW